MSEIPKDDPGTLNRSTSRSIVEGSALIELQASIRELEQERDNRDETIRTMIGLMEAATARIRELEASPAALRQT